MAAIDAAFAKLQESRAFSAAPAEAACLTALKKAALEGGALSDLDLAKAVAGPTTYLDKKGAVLTARWRVGNKLELYNVKEGANEPVQFLLRGRELEIVFKSLPDSRPEPGDRPTAPVPVSTMELPSAPPPRRRSWPRRILLAAGALGFLAVLFGRLYSEETSRIDLADSADVRSTENVSGYSAATDGNLYVIVEPLDLTRARWVQGEVATGPWTVYTQFGDANTPAGMEFRILLVATADQLPVGRLNTNPHLTVLSSVVVRRR
jgi:hypothetical protein